MSISRKPEWLRMKMPNKKSMDNMHQLVKDLHLHTVCEEACCPNQGECFGNRTATFMILGETCTRQCRFCAVGKGTPTPPDPMEPAHVAQAVQRLGLKHAVITSVTRDDLEDGGAGQFAETIQMIRRTNPETTIEVLVPDFQGNDQALAAVLEAKPHILNHNLETVPSLYEKVRPGANYQRSLSLLKKAKTSAATWHTKTGIMVGLGESETAVLQLMREVAEAGCDILTIGQYLQPTRDHLPVEVYVKPETFRYYRESGLKCGIPVVESGPFVRSSYNAAQALENLTCLHGDT